MTATVVHDMGTPWSSTNPGVLTVAVDSQHSAEPGGSSNRLAATAGAAGEAARFTPATALDLSRYDELRFWIRADRAAEGSPHQPFFLELSFDDSGDTPADDHRWFIPVNQPGAWEQRRIGIEAERRSAVSVLRLTVLTDDPVTCNVDELLAVREELLADVEAALERELDGLAPGGPVAIPLAVTASPLATQLVLPLSTGFAPGNHVLVTGGSAGDERHDVAAVVDDAVAAQTTLTLAPGDTVRGTLAAATAQVSLLAPLLFAAPDALDTLPTPSIVAVRVDAQEDLARTTHFTQVDSFRPSGSRTVCSVRPAPHAYVLDYRILARASDQTMQGALHERVVTRLRSDRMLRVSGFPCPVWVLSPPVLERWWPAQPSPVFRIGTHHEVAPRAQVPWISRIHAGAGPLTGPPDVETIVVEP